MEDIKNLESRVSKIENNITIAIAVALVFGIGGGFGYSILNKAEKRLDDLQKKIEDNAQIIKNQEKLSIDAVQKQEFESKDNLAKTSIVTFSERTIECKNPESGKKDECKCAQDEILVGLVRADLGGDGTDAEKITGIRCAKFKVKAN